MFFCFELGYAVIGRVGKVKTMQGKQTDLNQLILDIYDTALVPSSWPDVLDRLAHYLGARGAFMFEMREEADGPHIYAPHFSSGYDPALVRAYLARHREQEVRDQELFARHSRKTDSIELIGDDVLADSEAELLERANVQEMLRNGLRYRAGALLNKDVPNEDRFAIQYAKWQGPFDADRSARAALILPHLAKALNVSRPTARLAARYQSVATVLDRLAIGVCILDSKGSPVLRNAEFDRQLLESGVFRLGPAGHLIARQDDAARLLAPYLGHVLNHGQFGARPRKEAVIVPIRAEGHHLCIEIVPINNAGELGEANLQGHILYTMDTSATYHISGDLLKASFALSAAEVAVLELVASGMTNPQIAEVRNTSVLTVNTQVKSILAKLGASSRTQAIRLATSLSSSYLR